MASVTDMRPLNAIFQKPDWRIVFIALLVAALDQFTKLIVQRFLSEGQEKILVDGFFRFVCWHNTGAAWSFLRGRNGWLAVVAVIAVVVLFASKHHFYAHTALGQAAFGLIFGGIFGNLIDRVRVGYVVDFIRFYLDQRGGSEIGFPAFNVADSAICTGVGLVFLITWRSDRQTKATAPAEQKA